LLLDTLAEQLLEHGKITTTQTKAKRFRPAAEKLITAAKAGDRAARRRVMETIQNKSVVHTLFTEIGPRNGDNAPMAVIELVEGGTPAKKAALATAEKVAKKSAAKKA
jgi:large subunit ribosomal protein L17